MLRWIIIIPFALLVAMFVALLGLMVAATLSPDLARLVGGAGESLFRMLWDMAASGDDPTPAAAAIFARLGLLLMAVMVFPALITALVSEIFKLPSGLVQMMMCGALTALLPMAMLGLNRAPSGSETSIMGGLFLVGVVAGAVYWAIAGRNARRTQPATLPVQPATST
jgi:hypothetical protein